MKNTFIQKSRVSGFTLIELMVSLALGSVLVGGIAGMYLETRQNIAQDEQMARLQENARYTLELLKREIALSGFFAGKGQVAEELDAADVAENCAPYDWATELGAMEFTNDMPSSGTITTTGGTFLTCLDSADIQEGSDLIVLKRTADAPTLSDGNLMTADADTSQWYLRIEDYTNYSWVYLEGAVDSDDATPGSAVDYWEYYVKIFYLREYTDEEDDGIPALCQTQLVGDGMEEQCLVEGVEDLQFELGVDYDDDGVAERYLSNPGGGDFDVAVSMRVHILMRSLNTISNYTNEKSYRLGSRTIAPLNDGYIRKVFTTTVSLRNIHNS
ncbi:MAG: PilW family protein [Agarilytica sp.]